VDDEPEHVVLDEEAVGARLEDKRLGERLWRVVVCLEEEEKSNLRSRRKVKRLR
jgi:hypothetical protein